MAVEEVVSDLVLQVGFLGKWLQAIGIVVVLWIIMQIANWMLERKQIKKLNDIEKIIQRVEKKIDKLNKK